MEVHFDPATERKLSDLAVQTGSETADQLVQDVIASYFDQLSRTRATLNARYDDLKNGKIKPIPGDEIGACFREKSAAAHGEVIPVANLYLTGRLY